jgi:hypothetical protein
MAKLLNKCIPEIRGQKVEWRADSIYPCLGFWRIRRTEMDVMSWSASAYNEKGQCVWNGGCWETITQCLKAGQVHITGMYHDTISPDPEDD